MDGRIGLCEALRDLGDDRADTLIVDRLGRLARNLTVRQGTLAMIWALGKTVYAVGLGEVPRDDPNDPRRTALRQMIGVFSRLDHGMTVQRLRDARASVAALGGRACGAIPYGYTVTRDGKLSRLVADEREQRVVRLIIERRNAGASLRDIVTDLNTAGHVTKRRRSWHPASVRDVPRREGVS